MRAWLAEGRSCGCERTNQCRWAAQPADHSPRSGTRLPWRAGDRTRTGPTGPGQGWQRSRLPRILCRRTHPVPLLADPGRLPRPAADLRPRPRHPQRPRSTRPHRAKAPCRRCPIATACLQWATVSPRPHPGGQLGCHHRPRACSPAPEAHRPVRQGLSRHFWTCGSIFPAAQWHCPGPPGPRRSRRHPRSGRSGPHGTTC
ncbi:WhiB family transcriptional regulator [Streptomyces sp. NRRL S-813]|uniref:WhiB family transcriptional regulator n=1 Tax=Streptomyces sp. NRRL S-813 TaxID=1463919 RepID=UPI003B63B3F1